jgi:hypothetical protein
MENVVNMKLIFCIFEQLSGLKINLHRIEIYYFGREKDVQNEYRQGFEVGLLAFEYLGIPINYRKLLNKE